MSFVLHFNIIITPHRAAITSSTFESRLSSRRSRVRALLKTTPPARPIQTLTRSLEFLNRRIMTRGIGPTRRSACRVRGRRSRRRRRPRPRPRRRPPHTRTPSSRRVHEISHAHTQVRRRAMRVVSVVARPRVTFRIAGALGSRASSDAPRATRATGRGGATGRGRGQMRMRRRSTTRAPWWWRCARFDGGTARG